MSLSGKVALVTGGSNGIGKACIERLAKDGASVVINYNRDSASAEALVSAIGSDSAVAVQADVSSIAGVGKLVDAAVAKFGKIDIVMANAGLMPMRHVENTTEQEFDQCFDMNVKGPYFLAQVSLPLRRSWFKRRDANHP
jgi:3-oxoacyl-[acyl-carrier protein] reductase